MKLSTFLFAVLVLSFVACKGTKKSTEDKKEVAMGEQMEEIVTDKIEEKGIIDSEIHSLAVKRNACYGKCPTFEFTVDKTGTMTYNGKLHVEKLGLWKGQMDTDMLRDLWMYCSNLELEKYESTYKSGAMYAPMSSLKIGRKDSIQAIVGDFAMPAQIKSAMSYLDSLCNIVPLEIYEAKVPRSAVPGETIVNVKPDGTPEAICQSFAEYGLKVKKRVSPALSLYVLTFDENQNAGRLLVLLKNHPMVTEAQFNQNVDQRNN